jgi:hypothetical protein
VAEKARLDDTGVVEDEQVAGREQCRQVGKLPVREALTADMQQPAAAALGGRMLGDQFGRKGKVEVVDGQRHGQGFAGETKTAFRRESRSVVAGAPSQTRTGTPCGGGF